MSLERQLRPIYDALDTGLNKTVILSCNKLLKKHSENNLLKALKALALVRSQKVEEALGLSDEVLASHDNDEATLSIMMHVLKGLGRHTDMIAMFEEAYKKQPHNEELGAQMFFANVRTGNWKAAQQIATKLHKQFQEERFLYWSVISAILQANDPATPDNLRVLLYKLAHRLVTSSPTPSYYSADRFHLHLIILRELELYDEAHTLLDSEVGKAICSTNLSCDELRRDIWHRKGLWIEEGSQAEQRILEKNDRNWLEFVSLLDATFSYIAAPGLASAPDDAAKTECLNHISKTRSLLTKLAEDDGNKDRSAQLALVELEKRACIHGFSTDSSVMLEAVEKYFRQFGDKACCVEDLLPYVPEGKEDLSRFTSFLKSYLGAVENISEFQRLINVHKLLRFSLSEDELTVDLETTRAEQYLKEFLEGRRWGKGVSTTEVQPADDFIILTAQAYVSLWRMTGSEEQLYKAVSALEFACLSSPHSYKIRLHLVRLYRLLGVPSLALEHYRLLNVKQIQNDTLSHFILTRASTFSLAAIGDLTFPTECLESSQIYMSNSTETADVIIRAFTVEKYSQIPDFIVFEDRLDNSLQRDIVKMEHVRMRLTHEIFSSDLIDMELVELKFIFDRLHHDNRDFDILPNLQPRCSKSINEQTLLFDNSPGLGWLWIFLKIYIRALQHASDLDDTVEEKLLIGDRPKQSNDPENKLPLKERLIKRKEEELAELTPDELTFLDYATSLADWVEPHHDYIRPPASAILAEAAKQSEKSGIPLRGIDTFPQSEISGNGHAKKDEEAPPIKDAPENLSQFFDTMAARFKECLESRRFSDTLHVAFLTQEAFILLAVETIRFKSASTVKVYKLSALVNSIKTIRSKATATLRQLSTDLITVGGKEGTMEARKAFVEACKPIISEDIHHDFVLNVAKRVTDSRKKMFDGFGKGLTKVANTHQ